MANKKGRSLSDNDMSNVSGGQIVAMSDGRIAIYKNGKNVFKDGQTYTTADEALDALERLNKLGIDVDDKFTTEARLNREPQTFEQNG